MIAMLTLNGLIVFLSTVVTLGQWLCCRSIIIPVVIWFISIGIEFALACAYENGY